MNNKNYTEQEPKTEDMQNLLKKERVIYEQRQMPQKEVLLMKEKMRQTKKETGRKKTMIMAAVAAAAAVFLILPNTSADIAYAMNSIPGVGKIVELVTFRNYQYSDDRNSADVQVDKVSISTEMENTENSPGTQNGSGDADTKQDQLKKTADEINQEIAEITDRLVTEFKESKKAEEGYQDMVVKTETIATTQDYFTVKLLCYQGAGSGAEWDYFYTIDLKTGERLQLKDLFKEGSDYLTVISDEIKKQMKQQMDADENVKYWLDDPEVGEWNFTGITDETSFYLNGDGDLVICFNEGDVAPMYMGTPEFVIPYTVLKDIAVFGQ